MASYTIEDIELIRAKSGISYQEALSLLEYHNGNVARALVDLERNGRIKPNAQQTRTTSTGSKGLTKNGLMDLLGKLYRARLCIKKGDTTVVNLSSLFCIATLIFAPHLLIASAIISLVLGYKFSFISNDPAFQGDNLERMVRNAADNVRTSVNDFARGFQSGVSGSAAQSSAQAAPANGDSFYSGASAQATYRASVPTMNVPVQVESQDGSVTVEGDAEGYTSATIE